MFDHRHDAAITYRTLQISFTWPCPPFSGYKSVKRLLLLLQGVHHKQAGIFEAMCHRGVRSLEPDFDRVQRADEKVHHGIGYCNSATIALQRLRRAEAVDASCVSG